MQEIGGGEIITERKHPGKIYLRWKHLWKFICKGNTRNEQILLEKEKILMGIFYMRNYPRRELILKVKNYWRRAKLKGMYSV